MEANQERIEKIKSIDRTILPITEIFKVTSNSTTPSLNSMYFKVHDLRVENNPLQKVNEVLKHVIKEQCGNYASFYKTITTKVIPYMTMYSNKIWHGTVSHNFTLYSDDEYGKKYGMYGFCSTNHKMFMVDAHGTHQQGGNEKKVLSLTFLMPSGEYSAVAQMISEGHAPEIFSDIITDDEANSLQKLYNDSISLMKDKTKNHTQYRDSVGPEVYLPISNNEYHLTRPVVHLGFMRMFHEHIKAKREEFGKEYILFNRYHLIKGGSSKKAGSNSYIAAMLGAKLTMLKSDPFIPRKREDNTELRFNDVMSSKGVFGRLRFKNYNYERYPEVKKLQFGDTVPPAVKKKVTGIVIKRILSDFMQPIEFLAELDYNEAMDERLSKEVMKWLFPDIKGRPTSTDYRSIVSTLERIIDSNMIIRIDEKQYVWDDDQRSILRDEIENFLRRF